METAEQKSTLSTEKKQKQTIYICDPNVMPKKIFELLAKKSIKDNKPTAIRRFMVMDPFDCDNSVLSDFHQHLGCQQPDGLRLPSEMTSFGTLEQDRVIKTFELAKKGFGEGWCFIITTKVETMKEYIEKYVDEKYNIDIHYVIVKASF